MSQMFEEQKTENKQKGKCKMQNIKKKNYWAGLKIYFLSKHHKM